LFLIPRAGRVLKERLKKVAVGNSSFTASPICHPER